MKKNGKSLRSKSPLHLFLNTEAAGGLLLIAASILAIITANSSWQEFYFSFLDAIVGPELTPKLGPMTVHLWVNDGLMAIFFLLVGLEIKREFVDGHLATWADRRLPLIAAVAGMAVPAAIYLAITGNEPALAQGWAIPAATDIAFAIAVLSLLGSRAPVSLKLFLTTVAIVDDMGAVAIIAVFYTTELNLAALTGAALVWLFMAGLNRAKVAALWPYVIIAPILWYFTLLSGVHATIAGVMAAFAIPFSRSPAAPDSKNSALHKLEHLLAKPVAFVVLPVFGFVNAGISLSGLGLTQLVAPLPLGIALGLFLGKQLGIFGSVWVAARTGFASKPAGASWTQIYGVALLCGIGFTMSLFIGGLAFADAAQGEAVKIGVIIGSLLSASIGYSVLRTAKPQKRGRHVGDTL